MPASPPSSPSQTSSPHISLLSAGPPISQGSCERTPCLVVGASTGSVAVEELCPRTISRDSLIDETPPPTPGRTFRKPMCVTRSPSRAKSLTKPSSFRRRKNPKAVVVGVRSYAGEDDDNANYRWTLMSEDPPIRGNWSFTAVRRMLPATLHQRRAADRKGIRLRAAPRHPCRPPLTVVSVLAMTARTVGRSAPPPSTSKAATDTARYPSPPDAHKITKHPESFHC